MPQWTNAQQEAIELRKSNLLVSAAAGSGKTAVLVERIIRLITEDMIDIKILNFMLLFNKGNHDKYLDLFKKHENDRNSTIAIIARIALKKAEYSDI